MVPIFSSGDVVLNMGRQEEWANVGERLDVLSGERGGDEVVEGDCTSSREHVAGQWWGEFILSSGLPCSCGCAVTLGLGLAPPPSLSPTARLPAYTHPVPSTAARLDEHGPRCFCRTPAMGQRI